MIKFLNCKIDLSKKVFEPRIETEFWVGKALKELQIVNCKLKILDIFAGTGCIGISILKNIKNTKVDFADRSKEAIEQIKINLKLNQVPKNKYKIYKSNLFEKLAPYRTCSGTGLKNKRYDVIFANPPYVALDRISEVRKEVLEKEPSQALFAGRNGMFWIEKFLKEVKNYLKLKGIFYMEFDPLQKRKIEEIMRKRGFQFSFHKDQFKKFRWLKAKPRSELSSTTGVKI
jgi:release factor glutamine methyltransferase